MKDYVRQVYEEGLRRSVYVPLKKKIDKKTKGSTNKFLTNLVKIIYGIIALVIAFLLFYVAYPFN